MEAVPGLEVDEFEIQITDEEHFESQNSNNCNQIQNIGKEDFEIPIDDTCNENLDPEGSACSGNKLEDTVHKPSRAPATDLLRASLSDVVLSQSLAFTGRNIEFEDGNQNANIVTSEFVESFHNFKSEQTNKEASPKEEFFNICADSDITQTAHSNVSAPQAAVPQLPKQSLPTELPLPQEKSEDIEDFDDAVNPPLLTSTLKTDAKEDSDDEFDFDLPTSKASPTKTVTFFSKEDTSILEVALPQQRDEIRADKARVNEAAGQSVIPAAMTQAVHDHGTLSNVVPQLSVSDNLMHSAPQQEHEDEDTDKKQDRSHIITSSAADWDNVETVEVGFVTPGSGDGAELMSSVPPLLSFSDVWQYFRSMDHTAVKDNIQVTVEKHGFAALVSRIFGPPRLNKELHDERELVFCIAATALDNREHQHLQSLQTIYRVLTGSRFNCQRYGSHWEEIGFQGRDPATDLRGAGMLALVQLVSFLQDESTAQLARDIYKLSLHPTQNFPFCVMCINISRISLQALREGLLNRECNRQKCVMQVVNLFYAASLLHLYRLWKQGKTICDSGFVIRDVETRAKKQTKELFKDFQAYLASQKAKGGGYSADGDKLDGAINFHSVVKSEGADFYNSKSAAELY